MQAAAALGAAAAAAMGVSPPIHASLRRWAQEEARRVQTLREVEPLIQARYSGPKGSTAGAALAAVRELLHEGERRRVGGAEAEDWLASGWKRLERGPKKLPIRA